MVNGMKDRFGRRAFLQGIGAATGVALLDGCASLPFVSGKSYTVSILGDTHFDAEPASVYHSKYDERNIYSRVQKEEFRRNGEMWRVRCRDLLAASGQVAQQHKADFMVQLGDLIQGDCDDAAIHRKMLADCLNLFRTRYPAGMPLLTVAGNHDYRGKGAKAAYFNFIEPYLLGELGVPVAYPAFSFKRNQDLWVFCNFESRNLKAVRELIEKDQNSRYVFLVTHGPFNLSDVRSWRWRLGGAGECAEERVKLYETLSRRRAVVLSGHTHTTSMFKHENKFGSFCEFTANSVWSKLELATKEPIFNKVEDYGRRRLNVIKGNELEYFKRDYELFRTSLTEYFFSTAAGHCLMNVSDAGVEMDFFPGASQKDPLRFKLI